MNPILDLVNNLIGLPPAGFEYMQYLFAGVIMVMIIKSVFMLFQYVAKLISGRWN